MVTFKVAMTKNMVRAMFKSRQWNAKTWVLEREDEEKLGIQG